MVQPEKMGASTNSIESSATIFSATIVAWLGLPMSSMATSSSSFPLTPPAALILSTAIWAPFTSWKPCSAMSPVRGLLTAKRIVPPLSSEGTAASSAEAAGAAGAEDAGAAGLEPQAVNTRKTAKTINTDSARSKLFFIFILLYSQVYRRFRPARRSVHTHSIPAAMHLPDTLF